MSKKRKPKQKKAHDISPLLTNAIAFGFLGFMLGIGKHMANSDMPLDEQLRIAVSEERYEDAARLKKLLDTQKGVLNGK